MVSSVMREFEEEREAIKNAVISSGNYPLMAEHRLSGGYVMEEIEKMVKDADCYIGVFRERWGDVPKDNNPHNLSVTAIEFEIAQARGIPMRIFVSDAEERDSRLEEFLSRVGNSAGKWFIRYDSIADLFSKIGISIREMTEQLSDTPLDLDSIKAAISKHSYASVSRIKDTVHEIYQKPTQFDLIENMTEQGNVWLVGERGIGKSVVLKKMVEKKLNEQKNVLFLRSEDILEYGGLDKALEHVCGTSLRGMLEMFVEPERLLLIIDSVEAIHRNSNAWQNFFVCISKTVDTPAMRIVFSIRQSDYFAFKESFLPDWGAEVVLEGLTDAQVRHILNAMQVETDAAMLKILKHPFYLEILDSLVNRFGVDDLHLLSNKAKFIRFHYEQIVCGDPSLTDHGQDREDFLSKMADDMLRFKRLKLHYMHAASPEFKSLRSDGIIVDDGTFVQFFHQLYFDFITSMKIIDSGSVAAYLKSTGNEPFLRSTVMFLLSYLHSEDFDLYEASMRDLIRDAGVDDYWKHLAITFVGQLNGLHDGEEELVVDLLDASPSFPLYFLKSAIENKNAYWLTKRGDSVFANWSKDGNFRHADLLASYISKAPRWLDE